MTLTNIQLFNLLAFQGNQAGNVNIPNALIGDFLSGGLEDLQHMSVDDVKDACTSYAKRMDAPFLIIFIQTQKKKFKALMLWVKDMVRA